MPERHLGLVPSIERGELDPFFALLAETVAGCFDLERLLQEMGTKSAETAPRLFKGAAAPSRATIAVAKDEAFSFYYPENLELLRHYGAECVYFSPLRGEQVPDDVQGLYIGGGFPEEYAAALSRQHSVHESIRRAVGRGVLTLAECGGFMFLTEEIETMGGERYPMVGIVPGKVKMQDRLAALGYREIAGTEGNFLLGPRDQAKGHEYHYSTFEPAGGIAHAYETTGMRGRRREGYLAGNVVAGYTHIHFASAPELAKRWVDGCVNLGR
jgi:cobyrinic acid a,c-diamide synthase